VLSNWRLLTTRRRWTSKGALPRPLLAHDQVRFLASTVGERGRAISRRTFSTVQAAMRSIENLDVLRRTRAGIPNVCEAQKADWGTRRKQRSYDNSCYKFRWNQAAFFPKLRNSRAEQIETLLRRSGDKGKSSYCQHTGGRLCVQLSEEAGFPVKAALLAWLAGEP
jgi:hypothetical protein